VIEEKHSEQRTVLLSMKEANCFLERPLDIVSRDLLTLYTDMAATHYGPLGKDHVQERLTGG
jgi:hypothetical protein